MTTKLEAAKALVAEHAAAVNEALSILSNVTAHTTDAVNSAVESATADFSQANDLLSQQINAATAQLKEHFTQTSPVSTGAIL